MNREMVFAQLYYTEIESRVLLDEANKKIEENNRRKTFVDHNRRFHKA